jgi:hypothetical protein
VGGVVVVVIEITITITIYLLLLLHCFAAVVVSVLLDPLYGLPVFAPRSSINKIL